MLYPAVKTCRNQRNKQRKSEENRRTICRNTVYAKYRYVPSTVRNFRNYSKSTQFLGANSVELIKKNPYILSDMVDGISFKTSDTIAFNMGLPKNSIMRIRSGIIHILRSAAYTSGHVYMPKDVLIEHTVYTLKVTDDEVIAAVSELLSSKELFQDKVDGIDAYYLYSYYESEYYIARRLIAMSQNTQKFTMTEEKAEKAIDALEAKKQIYTLPPSSAMPLLPHFRQVV